MYWISVVLLIALDLAALAAMVYFSLRLRNLNIATFWRGALGALAAIPLELARIFTGFALTKWLGVTQADDLLLMLLNMRMFNMPILVAGGFLGAAFADPLPSADHQKPWAPPSSAEAEERVACALCGRRILPETARRHQGRCLHCERGSTEVMCSGCGQKITAEMARRHGGICLHCVKQRAAAGGEA